MKKTMKKVCAGMLCATLALTLTTPVTKGLMKPDTSASADVQYDGDFVYKNKTFRFVYYGFGIRILSVKESGGDLEIPSEVYFGGVKSKIISIGEDFGKNQSFGNVYIPNTVYRIENNVFNGASINKLRISDNIELIGKSFCQNATVKAIQCYSKKIRKIGIYSFSNSKTSENLYISNWIVKYHVSDSVRTLDLDSKPFDGIVGAVEGSISGGKNVTAIRVSRNEGLLDQKYYYDHWNRNAREIYVNGEKVECKSATDVVPKIMRDNYTFFDFGYFNATYAKDKARYLLNDLGLRYYGLESSYKGKLSARTEYDICKKIHDYIVKEYTYNTNTRWSYGYTFNCHANTVCHNDAMLFAFLAECAGVDAEVIEAEELIPISAKERDELRKTGSGKVTPNGKYKYGFNGDHNFNYVKIGGEAFYIDVTFDRCTNDYGSFLVSDETMNHDTSESHHYRHFYYYEDSVWSRITCPFGNREIADTISNDCYRTHGDIDMDYYCRASSYNDFYMLRAFLLLSDSLKNAILSSKNGYISVSDSDIRTLNALVVDGKKIELVKKVNGKVKLLLNPKELDVNFDGIINSQDMVAIMELHGHPMD